MVIGLLSDGEYARVDCGSWQTVKAAEMMESILYRL